MVLCFGLLGGERIGNDARGPSLTIYGSLIQLAESKAEESPLANLEVRTALVYLPSLCL